MQLRFFEKNDEVQQQLLIATLKKSELIEFTNVAKKTYAETYLNFFSAEQLNLTFGEDYLNTELPNQLNDDHYVYLVAKKEGNIIGYAKLIYEDNNDSVFLDKLYLLNEYRGQGIGKALLHACFQHGLTKNKSAMHLQVLETNQSAMRFYEKNGFVLSSEKIPYVYADGSVSPEMDYVMSCNDMKVQLHMKNRDLTSLSLR